MLTKILVQILPGIIIAIVAAILGSYLAAKWSFRRFCSEKWWERRERAYTEIIDSFYDIIQYLKILKEEFRLGYSKEKMGELELKFDQACWEVKRATHRGTFVMSHEANKILNELGTRPRLKCDENPPWDIYERDYRYYNDALSKMIDVAKEDLGASRLISRNVLG